MKLFKKKESKYWHFDFTVRGQRYRGSTKETKEVRANKVAGMKLAAAIEGNDPLERRTPTLAELARKFLEWLGTARLADDSRRYYRNGWRLLRATRIIGLRLNAITKDMVGPSNRSRTSS